MWLTTTTPPACYCETSTGQKETRRYTTTRDNKCSRPCQLNTRATSRVLARKDRRGAKQRGRGRERERGGERQRTSKHTQPYDTKKQNFEEKTRTLSNMEMPFFFVRVNQSITPHTTAAATDPPAHKTHKTARPSSSTTVSSATILYLSLLSGHQPPPGCRHE